MNTIEIDNNKIISYYDMVADNKIKLSSDTIILYKNSSCSFDFIVNENIKIFEYFNKSNCNNNYLVKGKVVLNRFAFDSSILSNIKLFDNSTFTCNYSCININNNFYKINIEHGKNTNSNIISNGINMDNNKLDFIINGIIMKDSSNVKSNQDSKIIIMKDNNCLIKPNLIVNNNEIDANHSSYIGHFKDNEMFYLQSRGIGLEEAKKLLAKAFLINKMDIDYSCKNIILRDLNDNWRWKNE